MRDEDLSYFEEDEFKDCLARYEEKRAQGESVYLDPAELTDIADYYMSQGRNDEAEECIDYAIRLHPGSVDPLVFKARQYMFAGEYETAADIRDQILDQSDREVVFLNGELILRTQNARKASTYWHQMGEQYADEEADYAYEVTCIFLDYGQYREAEEWLETYKALAPHEEKRYLTLRVDILSGQPERHEQAIQELDALLDKDPYNTKYWLKMAQLKMMQNDMNGAIDACEYALAVDEDFAQAAATKVHAMLGKGEFEEAHRLILEHQQKFGVTVQTLVDDGVALNNLGRFEEAVAQLEKARQAAGSYHEDLAQIHLHLSFAYSKLKRLQEAVDSLEHSHAVDPDAFCLPLLKGHIYVENDLVDEALELYEQALTECNDIDVCKLMIAVSLCDKRHFNEAYEYLDSLVNNGKEEIKGTAYAYMALYQYCTQDFIEFLYYLKLSCIHDPDTTEQLFSEMFPGVEPSEYYNYLNNKMENE